MSYIPYDHSNFPFAIDAFGNKQPLRTETKKVETKTYQADGLYSSASAVGRTKGYFVSMRERQPMLFDFIKEIGGGDLATGHGEYIWRIKQHSKNIQILWEYFTIQKGLQPRAINRKIKYNLTKVNTMIKLKSITFRRLPRFETYQELIDMESKMRELKGEL